MKFECPNKCPGVNAKSNPLFNTGVRGNVLLFVEQDGAIVDNEVISYNRPEAHATYWCEQCGEDAIVTR